MGFGQAISACFRRFVDFRGRSQRAEFWYWTLFVVAMNLLTRNIPVASLIWALIAIIPGIAVTIRRFHDIDRTGWWSLVYYGPYLFVIFALLSLDQDLMMASGILFMIGAIAGLVFWVQDGTAGQNRYGPDPKGRMDVDDVFD